MIKYLLSCWRRVFFSSKENLQNNIMSCSVSFLTDVAAICLLKFDEDIWRHQIKPTGWFVSTRDGVLENILGLEDVLEDTFWSPWPRSSSPWPRSLGSSKIALSLARGQHYFEPLKFWWKTPETSRKICKYLFCFPQLEHRLSQAGLPPNWNFTNDKNVTKKPIVSSVSVSF